MPPIRIDAIEGRPDADLAAIGAAIHRALEADIIDRLAKLESSLAIQAP